MFPSSFSFFFSHPVDSRLLGYSLLWLDHDVPYLQGIESLYEAARCQLEANWKTCVRLITFFVFAQYVLAVLLLSFFGSFGYFSFFRFIFAQSLECAVCSMPWVGPSDCRRPSETSLATGYDMHSSMWLMWFSLLSLDLSSFTLSFLLHFPFIVPFCDLLSVSFLFPLFFLSFG